MIPLSRASNAFPITISISRFTVCTLSLVAETECNCVLSFAHDYWFYFCEVSLAKIITYWYINYKWFATIWKREMSTKPFTEFTFIILHKKAFQSNANWLFADWVDSIMNKFEHVWDGRSTVRSKLKKFKHVSGLCTEEEAMALYRRGWALNRDSPISCGHTHTQLKTVPPNWRAAKVWVSLAVFFVVHKIRPDKDAYLSFS